MGIDVLYASLHVASFLRLFFLRRHCPQKARVNRLFNGRSKRGAPFFPLDITSSLPLVDPGFIEKWLPSGRFEKLEGVKLPNLFEIAHQLKEKAPVLAFQFFILSGLIGGAF